MRREGDVRQENVAELVTFLRILNPSEMEFKEFEPRFKYDWFHLKLYQMFQDLSRR